MGKSIKTTVAGVLTIVVAIGDAVLKFINTGAVPDLTAVIAAVIAGIGLIFAKDYNVTGGGK